MLIATNAWVGYIERVDATCLHPVNAASVRQDGEFDEKTIAYTLFIAQILVGLRDESYYLLE